MRKSTNTKPSAVDRWRCGRRADGCTSKTHTDGSCGIAGESPLAVLREGAERFSREVDQERAESEEEMGWCWFELISRW